jgi:trehalose-6-phosphatase
MVIIMKYKIPKFNKGDIVEYIGSESWGKKHIINKCDNYEDDPDYIYYTNEGGWIDEKDFKLIKKATKKSIKKLLKDLKEE